MLATSGRPYISPEFPDAVRTEAAGDERVTRKPDDTNAHRAWRDAWNSIIDNPLIQWGLDVHDFEDEGIPPPTRETLSLAGRIAIAMCDDGCPPPTRVVPDAHGGVVFERRQEEVFETIRISSDGRTEYCVFENAQLMYRKSY
jgi:hypothetical protein